LGVGGAMLKGLQRADCGFLRTSNFRFCGLPKESKANLHLPTDFRWRPTFLRLEQLQLLWDWDWYCKWDWDCSFTIRKPASADG